MQLVDIRSYDAFWKERVRGAISLPHNRVVDRAEMLDPGLPIVLYGEDENDQQVQRTGEALVERDFAPSHILIYKDGLIGWRAEGYFTDAGDESITK